MRIHSVVRSAALLIAASSMPLLCQQTGYVKMKVSPGRAGVFVDGKYVGPAANFGVGRKYSLAAGDHEIKLTEPRYEEVTTKVTVQAGKTVEVAQTMKALPLAKPPFGILRTIAPDKFSAVYINGKFMGHAGEFNNVVQGLKLSPGSYAVKIVPVGGGEGHEQQVQIEADKTTIVRAQ